MRKRALSLIVALLLGSMATTALSAPSPDPSKPTIHFYSRPGAETTDTSIMILSRVSNAQKVILFVGLPNNPGYKAVPMELVNPATGLYRAFISPLDNTSSGEVRYYVEAVGSNPNVTTRGSEYRVPVFVSRAPDLDLDEGLPETEQVSSTATTKVRIFYDPEQAANMVNDYNLTNVSSQTVNPFAGTSWPYINSKMAQNRNIGSNPHNGWDLGLAGGSEVRAILAGKVTEVTPTSYSNSNCSPSTVYFTRITIGHNMDADTAYEFYSVYLHLEYDQAKIYVKNEDTVTAGQRLGLVDGDCGNRHLHLEVRQNLTNNYRLPQFLFWKNRSALDYGKDVDMVIKPVTDFYTHEVRVVAYALNENSSSRETFASNAVRVYWRVFPNTVWSSGTMTQLADKQTYQYFIPDDGDAEFYISARRYSTQLSNLGYRPLMYQCNSTSDCPAPDVYFYASFG